MNTCPRCGKVLVTKLTAIALEGKLYCGKACAKISITNEVVNDGISKGLNRPYKDSRAIAMERYEAGAEEVSTHEVLSEDLHDVQVAVTIYKTVKMPKCLTEKAALERVEKLWNDGSLDVDYDNCDDVRFECVLVK